MKNLILIILSLVLPIICYADEHLIFNKKVASKLDGRIDIANYCQPVQMLDGSWAIPVSVLKEFPEYFKLKKITSKDYIMKKVIKNDFSIYQLD